MTISRRKPIFLPIAKASSTSMKMNNCVHKYYWYFFLSIFAFSCSRNNKQTIGENEFYTCSMDPQVLEKQPGRCPICKMELTKTVIDKSDKDLAKLSDEQLRLGNIRIDTIKPGTIDE